MAGKQERHLFLLKPSKKLIFHLHLMMYNMAILPAAASMQSPVLVVMKTKLQPGIISEMKIWQAGLRRLWKNRVSRENFTDPAFHPFLTRLLEPGTAEHWLKTRHFILCCSKHNQN